MNWNGPSDAYYITSDTGYRVSYALCQGEHIYTAWPPGAKVDTPAINNCESLDEAKEACEEHQRENNRSNP